MSRKVLSSATSMRRPKHGRLFDSVLGLPRRGVGGCFVVALRLLCGLFVVCVVVSLSVIV